MVYIEVMANVKLKMPIFLAFILAISCGSGPKDGSAAGARGGAEEPFDPTRVTRAYYDATMEEVQRFMENLNSVIRSRNYNAWRAVLSNEYFAEISSASNLRQISEQPAMRTRRIILRTAEDYFQYVVVPSRANLHVDEIEFVSRSRVQAFTVTTNRAGEPVRLRLYDLEKTGNSWTIIN